MPGIELRLLDGSLLTFKVNAQGLGPSEPPGFGRDSESTAPRREHVLGTPLAWRHRKYFLSLLPSALRLHMLPAQSHGGTGHCPGLWAAAGPWATCMPSAGVKVSTSEFPSLSGVWGRVPVSACASVPCTARACCMRDAEPVRAVRVVACRLGRREPGLSRFPAHKMKSGSLGNADPFLLLGKGRNPTFSWLQQKGRCVDVYH